MECFSEPTLAEVLSDPLVQEVMASDGVDPTELEAALVEIAGDIRQRTPKRKCWRDSRERRFAPAVPHLPVTRRAWRVSEQIADTTQS
jgi:hypothetical protein